MNPNWIQIIYQKMKNATRQCPHCGRAGVYLTKQPGEYYTCKFCQRQFREKGT